MNHDRSRQVVFWRLLAAMYGLNDKFPGFDKLAAEIAGELGLPDALLDPRLSIDALVQRHPELRDDFDRPLPGAPDAPPDDRPPLRRALVFSKLLLNAFGPNTQTTLVTAPQYGQWLRDRARLQGGFGGRTDKDVEQGLELMEGDLVKRMAIEEVLKDDELAGKLTPSMPLVEQLLLAKANLSPAALANAKRLIRAYIDELAEVLRLQVAQAKRGKLDPSVPPKRVFRNLDLKRTLWKNLTNWSPDEQRLYVDRLFYRRTAIKKQPTRLIVVVDQSGSMVDAMVQSTILASIFAGLPNVDVHLLAFDTQVLDLTAWVHDPFEVLLRTNLGGGTYIYQALVEAEKRVVEPRHTAVVLISDFFEGGSDQVLLDYMKSLKDAGVHVIPVGALTASGYFSVHEFFRTRLKELGMPILSGSVTKLIHELRYMLG